MIPIRRGSTSGQQPVDDRGDHLLPVGPEKELLAVERGALARAVEDEDVVAAA